MRIQEDSLDENLADFRCLRLLAASKILAECQFQRSSTNPSPLRLSANQYLRFKPLEDFEEGWSGGFMLIGAVGSELESAKELECTSEIPLTHPLSGSIEVEDQLLPHRRLF